MRLLGYLARFGMFAVAVSLSLVIAAPAVAHDRSHHRSLSAFMNGRQEVPGPGDPDGVGKVRIALFPGRGAICYSIRVRGITLPASAAHLHAAPWGSAGPVVVTLGTPDANGKARGCVTGVDPLLIKDIRMNPRQYYVNVHTTDFPDGAVRGQLHLHGFWRHHSLK